MGKSNEKRKTLSYIKRLRVAMLVMISAMLLPFFAASILWLKSDETIAFNKSDFTRITHQLYRDRYGNLLRFPLNEQEERNVWLEESKFPKTLKNAFLAAEDSRFYQHSGYDLRAIFRAFISNLMSGRIVSGASTISQQLIRMIYPVKRSYPNKLREIVMSAKMENELSKSEIMEQYLNRVPMGNQLRGVEAAALRYFDKSCAKLTISESALLAALPKSPSYLNPYGKHTAKLFARKDWILERMNKLGFISESEYKAALLTQLSFNREPFPSHAGHFVDMLMQDGETPRGDIVTTLDLDLQNTVTDILRSYEYKLENKGASQASAVVVDNRSMEVLTMVGSLDYAKKDEGYNNGALALRSAGSTLKPFLYALALERGYTTASILADTEKHFPTPTGGYLPTNYDKRYYGPVSIRNALGNSLNISAVKMLNMLGLNDFYRRLNDLSLVEDKSLSASHYGVGLAVGNMEVMLTSLVQGYATLANYGLHRDLKYLKGGNDPQPVRVMQPETAYLITDILSDPNARTITFGTRDLYNVPYKLALKTGTSTFYRDAWVVGYTPDYTVGVWVGNFDGSGTYRLSGASGAGPIMRDIMNHLYQKNFPMEFEPPEKVVKKKICSQSGMRPSKWCATVKDELFIEGTDPVKKCSEHKSKENFRSLSPKYAKWLYEKKNRGIEGSFRLADYDNDLDKVFLDPADIFKTGKESASIRVANLKGVVEEYDMSEIVADKHYSIGKAYDASEWSAGGITAPRIIYPLPDDRFIIGTKDESSYLTIQAQSDAPVKYLLWTIDGVEYAKTPPPFIIYYKPVRGAHSVSVFSPNGIGSSINFSVE